VVAEHKKEGGPWLCWTSLSHIHNDYRRQDGASVSFCINTQRHAERRGCSDSCSPCFHYCVPLPPSSNPNRPSGQLLSPIPPSPTTISTSCLNWSSPLPFYRLWVYSYLNGHPTLSLTGSLWPINVRLLLCWLHQPSLLRHCNLCYYSVQPISRWLMFSLQSWLPFLDPASKSSCLAGISCFPFGDLWSSSQSTGSKPQVL
jgi:hypothetical protein